MHCCFWPNAFCWQKGITGWDQTTEQKPCPYSNHFMWSEDCGVIFDKRSKTIMKQWTENFSCGRSKRRREVFCLSCLGKWMPTWRNCSNQMQYGFETTAMLATHLQCHMQTWHWNNCICNMAAFTDLARSLLAIPRTWPSLSGVGKVFVVSEADSNITWPKISV